MNPTALRLLRAIGQPTSDGTFVDGVPDISRDLLDTARTNKIGALYAREAGDSTKDAASLFADDESLNRFKSLERTTARVGSVLRSADVKFSVVKTPMEFPADFSDVDIYVPAEQLDQATETLLKHDYIELGRAPKGRDYEDQQTGKELDVQCDFGLRKVVYLSGPIVHTYSRPTTIGGTAVRAPSPAAQACLLIIHSVTEQLFLLRDFYHLQYLFTTMESTDVRTFEQLVSQTGLVGAVRTVLPLVANLSERAFDSVPEAVERVVSRYGTYGEFDRLVAKDWQTPHRYQNRNVLRTAAEKFRDPVFRRSVLAQTSEFKNPRIMAYCVRYLAERQRRETY